MKKTSPLVIALLLSMTGAIKLSQNTHYTNFLATHDFDVYPNTTPVIQPSPVKTSIKGQGCNADACPSTKTSCCMVSPDKNMSQKGLGKLAQKDDEKTVEKTVEKKVEAPKDVKAKNPTGEPIDHCCKPMENGVVKDCQKEKAKGIPYCALDKLVAGSWKGETPKEEKTEVKDEKAKDEKAKDEQPKKLAQTPSGDYDIQNPTLKVVDKPSPVKTSIKGKGCTAEACDATRAPCCKIAKPEEKKDEAKKDDKKDDVQPKKLAQTPSGDYDIQNPTLKVVDKPSPVKTSIKGPGCTAEACPAPRAPCCKLAAPESKPPGLSQKPDAGYYPLSNPSPPSCNVGNCPSDTRCCKLPGQDGVKPPALGQKPDAGYYPVQQSSPPSCNTEKCPAPRQCCKQPGQNGVLNPALNQKPDSGVHAGNDPSPPSCKNVEKCPSPTTCCLQPGQTGVKGLAQKPDQLNPPSDTDKGNARGKYEEGYNKDAKAVPARGCCDPLANGAVSQCRYEHDVHGVPYCAVDGIINNPNNKAPLPTDDSKQAKPEVKAPPKDDKKKDKFTDTLGLVQTPSGDFDIQNPTLKVVDKPSPVKTSIKGKGCTAEACDATRAPCCKIAKPEDKKDDAKKDDQKDDAKDKKSTGLAQQPGPSQEGWNTQMNAIKDANKAENVTKCTNSSHKCSDVGGKKQSNSDDTCCQEKDEVEEKHQMPAYPFPKPPTPEKEKKDGEEKK